MRSENFLDNGSIPFTQNVCRNINCLSGQPFGDGITDFYSISNLSSIEKISYK